MIELIVDSLDSPKDPNQKLMIEGESFSDTEKKIGVKKENPKLFKMTCTQNGVGVISF